MPSALFLESLENRTLLSALVTAVGPLVGVQSRPFQDLAAQIGVVDPGGYDLARDARYEGLLTPTAPSSHPMEIAQDRFPPADTGVGDGNNHSSVNAVFKGDNYMPLAAKVDFLNAMGLPFPNFQDDMHDHQPPPDGVRDGAVEMVNSLVDGDSAGPNEAGDAHADLRHHDQDATKVDGVLGSQGSPGVIFGGASRPLDNLSEDYDLADPLAGLDQALLAGPLADTFILDGWGEGVPAPRADLVSVTGRDLTVMPAYLVSAAPKAASPNLEARAVDPGSTHFIVGVWAPQAEQTGARTAHHSQSPDPIDQIVDSLRLTQAPAVLPVPAATDMDDAGGE